MTQNALAEKYGVHANTISNISRKEDWNDIKTLILCCTYFDKYIKYLCGSTQGEVKTDVGSHKEANEGDKQLSVKELQECVNQQPLSACDKEESRTECESTQAPEDKESPEKGEKQPGFDWNF